MNTTAADPLISNDRRESFEDRDYDSEDGSRDDDVDESKLASPGAFIWTLTFCAGVSGLLFGYDTGVISSTLVSIDSDLSSRPLTTLDKSLITSCTSLFALIASPLTGLLADHWGRKNVILLCDALFVGGAVWQAVTGSVAGMIGGRSVVGAAVGGASFVVPLYISELSPSPFRGRLVTISTLLITGGQVVAYIIGWLFSTHAHGWRWMVGLGALPAAIQFLILQFMPETPRWLVKANRKEQAKRVLSRVYGVGEDMDELVTAVLRRVEREILEEEDAAGERDVPEEGKMGWRAQWARINDNATQLIAVGGNRRALVIACMLQGFQQLCGFNSLMYFSATIFSLVGFRSPTLTSLSIALTNFFFTLLAFYYIDRVGRRRILLWSVPIMIIGLVLCSVAFNFIQLPAEKASVTVTGSGIMSRIVGRAAAGTDRVWPLVILLAMVTYVAGYAIGMGNVPWQQSELFPLRVRSLGSALSTATNWASNFVIGITFLPMMELFTPVGTFAFGILIPSDLGQAVMEFRAVPHHLKYIVVLVPIPITDIPWTININYDDKTVKNSDMQFLAVVQEFQEQGVDQLTYPRGVINSFTKLRRETIRHMKNAKRNAANYSKTQVLSALPMLRTLMSTEWLVIPSLDFVHYSSFEGKQDGIVGEPCHSLNIQGYVPMRTRPLKLVEIPDHIIISMNQRSPIRESFGISNNERPAIGDIVLVPVFSQVFVFWKSYT
ncbi:and other transporter-domain-containing protein [Clohesyomyces aquaticus]|uniref:And other transporter-domain-containing protein n=1 Tax=Clohesyomyces aquaticus TaxID=1231657 RepID=A0A1Y1ZLI3_9PLEO|nr:and other transporter-domain-containing protein [Clohesyomyces aquaticus]